MAGYDRTEGKLKIVGFVGGILTGLSGVAVATWKMLKEGDKLHMTKPPKEIKEEKKPEEEASK